MLEGVTRSSTVELAVESEETSTRLRKYWCALSRLRNAQIRFDGQLDGRRMPADRLGLLCPQPHG
jgi:hypothetical protein